MDCKVINVTIYIMKKKYSKYYFIKKIHRFIYTFKLCLQYDIIIARLYKKIEKEQSQFYAVYFKFVRHLFFY